MTDTWHDRGHNWCRNDNTVARLITLASAFVFVLVFEWVAQTHKPPELISMWLVHWRDTGWQSQDHSLVATLPRKLNTINADSSGRFASLHDRPDV